MLSVHCCVMLCFVFVFVVIFVLRTVPCTGCAILSFMAGAADMGRQGRQMPTTQPCRKNVQLTSKVELEKPVACWAPMTSSNRL